MDNEMETVARVRDAVSAHICARMLNENGIPAAVFGENSSYISLNYIDELEVKVNPEDYDQAVTLIEQKD